MSRLYAQVICNWGSLLDTCKQQHFVFKKTAYRLNETGNELHILGDKKNCSLRRFFRVPTTYVLVEAFKVCCNDISFIVVLFDLRNSCKRLQIFSHICNHGLYVFLGAQKSRLIETAILSLIFFAFKDISFTVVSFLMIEEVCYTDFIFAFKI